MAGSFHDTECTQVGEKDLEKLCLVSHHVDHN